MPRDAQRAGSATRRVILEAALRGFAHKGFEATSTREIAALAGTNVASIAYHFGGKDGLRAACAEHVVETLRAVTAPLDDAPPPTPAAARARLEAMVRRFATFALERPEAGLVVGFMMREASQPSVALDTVYAGVIEGAHRRVCALWGAATGADPDSDAVRLAVFAMVGQVLYFRIARPIVERRLGWADIGPAEARAVAEQVTRNLRARLDADTAGGDGASSARNGEGA
jgi:AcrR family transcriptional regulator